MLWVVSSVVVLLGIGYFGANMAVSYVLKSMVPQVPVSISDISEEVNNPKGSIESAGTNEVASDASEAPIKLQESSEKKEIKKVEQVNETADSPKQAHNEVPESPKADIVNSQKPTPEAAKDGLDYQAQITTDKAKAVEDSISLKEKATVTSVLLKKLSASDLQLFAKMASNGLSVEEKKDAKEIILKKLSEDEYNQLIQIAAKYGLSQGKSYQDSKKEFHK